MANAESIFYEKTEKKAEGSILTFDTGKFEKLPIAERYKIIRLMRNTAFFEKQKLDKEMEQQINLRVNPNCNEDEK